MHELATAARSAFFASVDACDPRRAIPERCTVTPDAIQCGRASLRLVGARELFVISIGKSAATMAAGLEALLRREPACPPRRGIVVAHEPSPVPDGYEFLLGEHPVPGPGSFHAGRVLLRALRTTDESTPVLFLVGGGASSIVEAPAEGVLIDDVVAVNEWLLRAGLDIETMNAARTHLSAIKGGGLARACRGSHMTLIVSDVPPGRHEVVGSGPTIGRDRDGISIRASELPETLSHRARRALFQHSYFYGSIGSSAVLLDSRDAARAAAVFLESIGLRVEILADADGPLEHLVDRHVMALTAGKGRRAVVSAGEATLRIWGDGIGGRNEQFVLHALTKIEANTALGRFAILSAGTDGRDGLSSAAGAIADESTLERAAKACLDPHDFLRNNDAHRFFEPLGALVVTGPTGTNVRDVRIFIAE